VTLRDLETLLVLMVARMPGLSLEISMDGGGAQDPAGFRLVHGKLEAGRRSSTGEIAWEKLPHHTTLIGAK
jgi:hypothetical protein